MTMTKEPEDKLARAREQALAQFHSVAEMVGKLRAADDDDTYSEMAKYLAEEAGFSVLPNDQGGYSWAKEDGSATDETSHEDDHDAWMACCDDNGLRPDADEARQAIEEDALSVHRSGPAGTAPARRQRPRNMKSFCAPAGRRCGSLASLARTMNRTARGLSARIGSPLGPRYSTGSTATSCLPMHSAFTLEADSLYRA